LLVSGQYIYIIAPRKIQYWLILLAWNMSTLKKSYWNKYMFACLLDGVSRPRVKLKTIKLVFASSLRSNNKGLIGSQSGSYVRVGRHVYLRAVFQCDSTIKINNYDVWRGHHHHFIKYSLFSPYAVMILCIFPYFITKLMFNFIVLEMHWQL
jgi:hypothetical protein